MFKNLFFTLWKMMERKTVDIEEYLTNLGWFLIVTFPVFYVINRFIIGLHGYESFFLRLSIGGLGLIFVIRNYLSNKTKMLIPFIYYWAVIYAFPFFFFFMLFNNPDSDIWKINTLNGLFFLSFFFNWKEYLIFSGLGFFLAWVTYSLTSTSAHLPADFSNLVIIYANPAVYLALFFNKRDHIIREKVQAIKSLAGTIAHEMRTPLLAIRSSANTIKKFQPLLIDSYRKAQAAGMDIQPISESKLTYLTEMPENLDKITLSTSMVIDMLLMNLKDVSASRKHFEVCSIKACVAEMFHEYPLTKEEKSLISWEDHSDFTFYGNTLLMKHILFNLLKNALYYVKAANKGAIFLWTETTPKGNFLHFKDTGKGMPASMISHIFDPFYTQMRHGTGVGLAFCKSVMDSFGGSISCASKEGEYTTFILKFPLLKQS